MKTQSNIDRSAPGTPNSNHSKHIINWTHLMSCSFKELILIMRDVPLLVFTLVLPIMQLSVGLITFGGNPAGLSIAVVDYDTVPGNVSLSDQYLRYFGKGYWTEIKHHKSLQSGNRILFLFFKLRRSFC